MSNNLYDSYFSTVTTERKFPAKQTKDQPPPKKLSKSFSRQIAKTLGTTKTKKKRQNNKKALKGKTTRNKMSKRSAPDASITTAKKVKASAALPGKETDKDGQTFWEISGKRRLQLSEFKGTTMIGVREFYEKDGESLPGRKGISMTVEQFNTVVELLPQIERELGEKGIQLARPKYDSGSSGEVPNEKEAEDEEGGNDDEQEEKEEDGDAKAKEEEEEE